jgi:hypothetical protein
LLLGGCCVSKSTVLLVQRNQCSFGFIYRKIFLKNLLV